jgi:hypothetical protein
MLQPVTKLYEIGVLADKTPKNTGEMAAPDASLL